MITAPSVTSVALLVALSLFLGLAFEDFFARTDTRRPGGIRTFPMLALAGGVLYLFDPVHFVPFTAGLLVLGAWLAIFYRRHIGEPDETGEPNVGLVVPLLNVHAYLLGAVTLALPHWIAVGTTVAVVLLLTGREKLHALARQLDVREIAIAGEFLILSGIILPLLPNEPVTTLTTITPHQAWLALVVVSALSYVSYLAQRYWKAAASGLWMAALGGLYSSTATTVVLARQAKAGSVTKRQAQAGITLATAIMYLRILVIVAVFNGPLARTLVIPLCGLALAGLLICALQYRFAGPGPADADAPASALPASGANPLQLGPAALFAGAVRSGVARLEVDHDAVRHLRGLFARRRGRHYRHRSFRPQSGARGSLGDAERRAGGRDPHRRLLQQYSQGRVCRGFCRWTEDCRKRSRARPSRYCRRGHRLRDRAASASGNRESLTRRAMAPAPTPPARRPLG